MMLINKKFAARVRRLFRLQLRLVCVGFLRLIFSSPKSAGRTLTTCAYFFIGK